MYTLCELAKKHWFTRFEERVIIMHYTSALQKEDYESREAWISPPPSKRNDPCASKIVSIPQENGSTRKSLTAGLSSEFIGKSAAMRAVLRQIEIVAPTQASVLILGETGTGKEMVARAIHHASDRCNQTLAKVNCAAIPSGLSESEFFGHEKGAFTGAIARKIGRFEMAHRGTLFWMKSVISPGISSQSC